MLISVHIPKTAGTAFRDLLSRRFGDRLLTDYSDRPLSHGTPVRWLRAAHGAWRAKTRLQGYEAVHGHFLAFKYSHVDAPMVTWLRDPVQRMVSRYQHYLRDVAEGRPLQAVRGLRPGLRLDDFIELSRYHNTYAKYFVGVPRSRLSWVGFTEDVPGSLQRLHRTLAIDLGPALVANRNPLRGDQPYALTPALEARIRKLNRADVAFWEWARDRFG